MKSLTMRIVAIVTIALCTIVAAQGTALAESKGIAFGIKPGLGPVQGSYLGLDAGSLQPFVGLDLARISGSIDGDDASALLLVPNVGARLYFSDDRREGDVVPYVQGALLFSMASVSWDGSNKEDEKLVEDALGFWGLNFAFGSEYYFADRFSVGGEYGIRYFSDGIENDNEEASISLMMSYVSVSLNFYLK